MKTGSCSDQRQARPERVDLVLLVELHHLLVVALLVVLVLLLELLDLRRELLQRLHRLELLERQRDQQRAHRDRQRDDRHAPARPDGVVEEHDHRSKTSISGWKMFAKTKVMAERAGRARRGRAAEEALRLDGVDSRRGSTGCSAAGATPPAPSRAVCRTRGSPARRSASRSARTCSGAGSAGEIEPLVDARSGPSRSAAQRAHRARPRRRSALREQLGERARGRPRGPRARRARARPGARRRRRRGRPAAPAASASNASRSEALDEVALDGAADLARDATGRGAGAPRRARVVVRPRGNA